MRRAIGWGVLVVLQTLLLAGCGAEFELPSETSRGRVIPSDKSYQMLATWTGMTDVNDILLTQGAGSQLFILFNHPGRTGPGSRGEVRAYPLTRPVPLGGIDFLNLFNPVALASGQNRIFVLDQGDTCMARANPISGSCTDTTGRWNFRISHLDLYWRVREFGLLGGDSLTSFTDTTLAFVTGIAADSRGGVYVGGTAIVQIPSQVVPGVTERAFQYRIYRYERGPRYPGVVPPDRNLPGANWHRDTTFVIEEGAGIGSVFNPHGLGWSSAGGGTLYAADTGKNWVQKLYDDRVSSGYFYIDGGQSGTAFNGPLDVAADVQGFIYVADTINRRVVRYDPFGTYVQRVDVELDAGGQELRNPVAVAADDSLVYVGDPDTDQVIRYKRRP